MRPAGTAIRGRNALAIVSGSSKNLAELKHIIKENGGSLVAVADLKHLAGIWTYPKNLLNEYRFGISIGVALDKFGRYRSSTEDDHAFPLLKDIARRVRTHVVSKGWDAKVIVPDKRVQRTHPLYFRGEISHKAVAMAGGMGWMGKSTLLVTPDFGPRVCLVTVLTNMPLPTGRPTRTKCGPCRACIVACPMEALREGAPFRDHPRNVRDNLDIITCDRWVNHTWRKGQLCFECMLACPRGKRTNGRNGNHRMRLQKPPNRPK